MSVAFGFLFFMVKVQNERVRARRSCKRRVGTPAAKKKGKAEAGAERPLKGQKQLNLALSEGVEPERTGQATRKKVKGKLSGDNLPQGL